MATPKVRAATAASTVELCPDLPRFSPLSDGRRYSLLIARANHLSQGSRDALFNLFDANIGPLARGTSLTYTEASKREELFEPTTRFLLALANEDGSSDHAIQHSIEEDAAVAMPGALPSAKRSTKGKGRERVAEIDFGPSDLLGFCSFRFDTEETMGPRDAEVLYCYELQLCPSARGLGLGNVLIDEFERIGRRRRMDKGMLTCLSNNDVALRFYAKHGYEPDEIDPTRLAEEQEDSEGAGDVEEVDNGWQDELSDKVDYRILSKSFKGG